MRRHQGSSSDPGADVSRQVGVDPVDDAGVDISHLEQRWNLRVSGTAIDPNHISHAPGNFRVGDDHSRWRSIAEQGSAEAGRLTGGSLCQRQNGPSGKSFPEGVVPKISPVRRSRLMSITPSDSRVLQPNHLQTPSLNVAGLVSS